LHGGSLDDQLWLEAVQVEQHHEEVKRATNDHTKGVQNTNDDDILYKLLHCGVIDHSNFDKQWDSSTRSMRYLAAVGDWLWALLEKERARASGMKPC